MQKRASIKAIEKTSSQRGNVTEDEVKKALESLRDEFNAPIKVFPKPKWSKEDRQGVDFEIKGESPLHLWIGVDAKSSKAGVEDYRRKQNALIEKGVKNIFPRYPFLYERFEDSRPQLLLDLLRFIIKKSRTHSDYIDLIPEHAEDLGENLTEFNHCLRELIKYLFDELEPIYK